MPLLRFFTPSSKSYDIPADPEFLIIFSSFLSMMWACAFVNIFFPHLLPVQIVFNLIIALTCFPKFRTYTRTITENIVIMKIERFKDFYKCYSSSRKKILKYIENIVITHKTLESLCVLASIIIIVSNTLVYVKGENIIDPYADYPQKWFDPEHSTFSNSTHSLPNNLENSQLCTGIRRAYVMHFQPIIELLEHIEIYGDHNIFSYIPEAFIERILHEIFTDYIEIVIDIENAVLRVRYDSFHFNIRPKHFWHICH